MIRAFLLEFFEKLALALPPSRFDSHSIKWDPLDPDESNRLYVELHIEPSGSHAFYLDDADFEMPVDELVGEIKKLVDAPGRH